MPTARECVLSLQCMGLRHICSTGVCPAQDATCLQCAIVPSASDVSNPTCSSVVCDAGKLDQDGNAANGCEASAASEASEGGCMAREAAAAMCRAERGIWAWTCTEPRLLAADFYGDATLC